MTKGAIMTDGSRPTAVTSPSGTCGEAHGSSLTCEPLTAASPPGSAKRGAARAVRPEDLRAYYQARDETRRGVCLLNAGRFAEARDAFDRAARVNPRGGSLAAYLAAAYLGKNEPAEAARHLAEVVESEPGNACAVIRHALALWSAGQGAAAERALRDAISEQPNHAELQFQLGALLNGNGEFEEAELRFAQAVAIDGEHVEAIVYLALSYAARQAPADAVKMLQRAQRLRSGDARIGALLARAVMAAEQGGRRPQLRLVLPPQAIELDDREVEELAGIVVRDPEFLDALLTLSGGEKDEELAATLLTALRQALKQRPDHAGLHFHCSRVLDRLGRMDEAIRAGERAVDLDPTHVRALVELARLYQDANRPDDAVQRLSQVIRLGYDFADVYYTLGNVHRAQGRVERAAESYRHALGINANYEAARQAMESLPV